MEHVGCRAALQTHMGERVIPHRMSSGDDFPREARMGEDMLPKEKEGGLHVMGGENLQNCRGVHRVWPVVERNRNRLLARLTADHRREESRIDA